MERRIKQAKAFQAVKYQLVMFFKQPRQKPNFQVPCMFCFALGLISIMTSFVYYEWSNLLLVTIIESMAIAKI